jgi:hypothetical protein
MALKNSIDMGKITCFCYKQLDRANFKSQPRRVAIDGEEQNQQ